LITFKSVIDFRFHFFLNILHSFRKFRNSESWFSPSGNVCLKFFRGVPNFRMNTMANILTTETLFYLTGIKYFRKNTRNIWLSIGVIQIDTCSEKRTNRTHTKRHPTVPIEIRYVYGRRRPREPRFSGVYKFTSNDEDARNVSAGRRPCCYRTDPVNVRARASVVQQQRNEFRVDRLAQLRPNRSVSSMSARGRLSCAVTASRHVIKTGSRPDSVINAQLRGAYRFEWDENSDGFRKRVSSVWRRRPRYTICGYRFELPVVACCWRRAETKGEYCTFENKIPV